MKKEIGKVNALYPMPCVVIGTMAGDRENYIAIAHVGILDHTTVSVSSGKNHYSNRFIREHGALSINLLSQDMADRIDCAGIASGKEYDKSGLFHSVPGSLPGVPLIEEAPVTMECRVTDIYDRPDFDVFICEIVHTYVQEEVMTGGKPDCQKLKPVLFDMPTFGYHSLGERSADAFRIGTELRDRLSRTGK